MTGGEYPQPRHGLDPAHRAQPPFQLRVVGLDRLFAYHSMWCQAASHVLAEDRTRLNGDAATAGRSVDPARQVGGSRPVDLDEVGWLALERRPGETLRAGLERTLRDAILGGALRGGVRLPASRVLAHALGVSRGVVTDAYGQLEAQGFLVVRARSAPLVASGVALPGRGERAREPDAPQPRYDLTPTTPDVRLFPLRAWLAASEKVARGAPPATFDYGESRGEFALREALADHLGRTRGVTAEPQQIIVVQGTAQGLDVVLRTLVRRGVCRVAVEDPSHTRQHDRVRALGLELLAQPVDADGLVVDGLDADVVLVTPAHQFPTGAVLSGERRRQLLAWSQRIGAFIVEDDYDSEFRYDREPVRALQGLAPMSVVQLGTFSKTLAPALRLGWIVAPDILVDELEHVKRLVDDFSPALGQLAVAKLLTSGAYARHLRRARTVYRARRDSVVAALARELPDLEVEGIAAGVHVVLRLPLGSDDAAVASAASTARIFVPPLSAFRIVPAEQGGLVIGYGRVHEAAIAPGIRALARVVRTHL